MKLSDIIGTSCAVSPRTGLKAYEYVSELLSKNTPIILSFEGITDCTSAFCNSFIGKLYMDINPDKVDQLLNFEDLETNEIWLKKITNAKLLGSNENIRTIRKSSIDDLILN